MKGGALLLLGAGGHAQACIDVIEAQGRWRIAGLIGKPEEKGRQLLGYPVLGSDHDLPALMPAHALVAVGQAGPGELRAKLFALLRKLGCELPCIVAPTAWVSRHAQLGAGSIVMHGAIVNAGAVVGENCIINTGALVEHGARVGDHCHVATKAVLNGDVDLGACSFVGSGSQIRQGLRLGANCMVGMGASVTRDLPAGGMLKAC